MSGRSGDLNEKRREARDPDSHGQAALLLVESLLHGMIARSLIRTEDAIEIVAIAAEVKEEVALSTDESPRVAERSLQLLGAIMASLEHDVANPASRREPLL